MFELEIGIPLGPYSLHLCLEAQDHIIIPSFRIASDGGMMLTVSGTSNKHIWWIDTMVRSDHGHISPSSNVQSTVFKNYYTHGCTGQKLELPIVLRMGERPNHMTP
jgi:hypothetical protein